MKDSTFQNWKYSTIKKLTLSVETLVKYCLFLMGNYVISHLAPTSLGIF